MKINVKNGETQKSLVIIFLAVTKTKFYTRNEISYTRGNNGLFKSKFEIYWFQVWFKRIKQHPIADYKTKERPTIILFDKN